MIMPLRQIALFASKEICRPQNIAKAGDGVWPANVESLTPCRRAIPSLGRGKTPKET
jgi:hypothetical protein